MVFKALPIKIYFTELLPRFDLPPDLGIISATSTSIRKDRKTSPSAR